MKKTLLLSALLAIGCGAPEETADTPTTEPAASAGTEGGWVGIAQGDRTLHAYVVQPAGVGPHPAIIVIHQNRGFGEWIGTVAQRIADAGYIALAPDLLSGMAPGGGKTADYADSDAARAGIGELDQAQVTADLNAAADYLAALPNSDGRVSVSGFCWGGRQTFAFAAARPDLEAAYVFYGDGPAEPEAYANVGARVYGFYGGEDNRINATIDASKSAMDALGKIYEPVIYDGAGHGFMSRGETAEGEDPNAVAMEAGWDRWLELLEQVSAGG